jgi:hypothetical protein
MPIKKGQNLNPGGRPKGAKNKVPNDIVQKIVQINLSLAKKGKGLEDCANDDPKWFHSIFTKAIIPKNIEISGGTELTIGATDALMAKLNEIYTNRGRP